jgi:hypothetical protein
MGQITVDLTRYDAVFWSESSVEKFLVPYLASKYHWQAAIVLEMLARAWYGGVPRLLENTTDPRVDDTGQGLGEEYEGVPFAVGHLPRSEYVIIGGNVEILRMHPKGHVSSYPLSKYLGYEH